VIWPEIPKRNGPKKLKAVSKALWLNHITAYEYIRTQAEKIGQL